jgi:hypothetical protein
VASRFHERFLWNAGSPAFAGDDGRWDMARLRSKRGSAFSQADGARAIVQTSLKIRGRREDLVPGRKRGPCALVESTR